MALPAAAAAASSFWPTTAAGWGSLGSSVLGAVGSLFGNSSGASKEARHYAWEQNQLAKEAFYNGVEVRVADAKKAGVHPLAALGMNPYQGGASITLGDTGGGSSPFSRLAAAGSDISRALAAGQDKEQRIFNQRVAQQTIERGDLENELLRSQIAQQRAQLPPPVPTNSSAVKSLLTDLPTPIGSEEGLIPVHRIAYDEKGNPFQVYNSEGLGDSEVMTGLHAAVYSLPQFAWNRLGGRYFTDKIIEHRKRNLAKGQKHYSYKWPKGFYK